MTVDQDSHLTNLLLQMGQGSSTPSRDLINHVVENPKRINDTAEILSLPAQTLLHRSVFLGINAMTAWLIMKGADINAADGDGKTPLDHATAGEHKELVDYLRGKGARSGGGLAVYTSDVAVTDMVEKAQSTINIGQPVDRTVPATGICDVGMVVDTVENATMKSGESAFIFYLSITNNQSKQVRVELPFSTYVTAQNEEIEQDVWLTGLIIGGKGATIRAGAHKKTGLVFFTTKLTSISIGDQLHVLVELHKTSLQYGFTFRCADQAKRVFALVDAQIQSSADSEEPDSQTPNKLDSLTTEIIERFDRLEDRLGRSIDRIEEVLAAILASQSTGLDAIAQLQHNYTKNTESFAAELAQLRQMIVQVPKSSTPLASVTRRDSGHPESKVPALDSMQTFTNWLVKQDIISLSDLRSCLHPLDLLPGAVINDINERALDLIGEPALVEDGDNVIVKREVLLHVITDLSLSQA